MATRTFFLDIDGTLVLHLGEGQHEQCEAPALAGMKEMIDLLLKRGHYIVLTTGRREILRAATVAQLSLLGILYDQLVMGLPPGKRILVNDQKPDGLITAYAVSPPRNQGVDLSRWAGDSEQDQA